MDTHRPTDLDNKPLLGQMQRWTIGHTVHYYQQVESTMPLARALVHQSDSPASVSGSVIVAEEQLAGRGRRQRRWETPYGTALLTGFVLCPPHLPANVAHLPMISGLATVKAIAEIAPSLQARLALKWPNDVLIKDDPERSGTGNEAKEQNPDALGKVAGILVEAAFENDVPTHAILGIGINVNQQEAQLPPVVPGALPPTSLHLALGQPVDRARLLMALCKQLGTYVKRLSPTHGKDGDNLAHSAQQVHTEWRSLLHTLGQQVTVYPTVHDTNPVVGTARSVTADGSLIVVDTSGRKHIFAAGDVSLRSTHLE